jgi:drug/metabolite transporter (DMT)-like permease
MLGGLVVRSIAQPLAPSVGWLWWPAVAASAAEVLAAVLFAWLLLAQLPTPLQWLGGVLVIGGVVVVKWGEPEPAPEAALPTV